MGAALTTLFVEMLLWGIEIAYSYKCTERFYDIVQLPTLFLLDC